VTAAADFETLLKQAIGLDAASIGHSAVERAVQARLSACRLHDEDGYLEMVRSSATELQALIEAVVVSETWFFRDREAFIALARIASEEWLRSHAEGTLRLLSLPCSSGEEPYSMAMALLDAGLPAQRCRIDAIDVSAHVLALARHAIYGRNSFRGADLEFRDRFFEAVDRGYRLADAVRRQVHFRQGNLFAEEFAADAEPYDFIFCRNLLIYFDRVTQDRAVESLGRLLGAKGVLFVGPSETGLLLDHDFVPIRLPLAFAFRKRDAVTKPHAHAPARRMPAPKAAPVERAAARAKPEPAIRAKVAPTLTGATRLADEGRLVEAAKACEEHLRQHGSSAPAFYLLGVIRAAAGNLAEAEHFYRKALYLDREHAEALAHLALLLDKQGDAAGALVLRGRLSRLRTKDAK
jgi:chemotaxis protein methyltransferase WspC